MSEMKASNTTESLQPKLNIKLPTVKDESVEKDLNGLSQADIDRESSIIRLKAEQLKLKREYLELEKLTDDIENIRVAKSNKINAHSTNEDNIKYQNDERARHEEACNHKKGGEAIALLNNAPSLGDNSNNYAVLQHTLSSGVIFRMCMRCGRTWFPKDPDYRWAMRLPTRNSPSTGSPSPGLIRFPDQVRRVSEIPHKVIANPETNPLQQGPEGY